jgi:hypothetical protein
MGWAELGWPYTFGRMVRDLLQPSRYLEPLRAFFNRELRGWKELLFPLAMCWMQYTWSKRGQAKREATPPDRRIGGLPTRPAPASPPSAAPPSAPQRINPEPQRLAS